MSMLIICAKAAGSYNYETVFQMPKYARCQKRPLSIQEVIHPQIEYLGDAVPNTKGVLEINFPVSIVYIHPKKCDEFLTREKLTISILFEQRRDQRDVKTKNSHPYYFQTQLHMAVCGIITDYTPCIVLQPHNSTVL